MISSKKAVVDKYVEDDHDLLELVIVSNSKKLIVWVIINAEMQLSNEATSTERVLYFVLPYGTPLDFGGDVYYVEQDETAFNIYHANDAFLVSLNLNIHEEKEEVEMEIFDAPLEQSKHEDHEIHQHNTKVLWKPTLAHFSRI